MAARLQAASASGKPVLLRVDWQGGPGASRSRRDEERADIYAFLLWQFGHDGFVPQAPATATAPAPAPPAATPPPAAAR